MPSGPASRAFSFQKDTFAYANGLVWEYQYDAKGKWTTHKREPRPDYAQHCFVVARSARQFFTNARFAPEQPTADEQTYRRLIAQVISSSPRKPLPESKKIVIPGYADLRSFSAAHERLLKENCGGAYQCYIQRGNWRVIFPFSRRHQAHTADQLVRHLTTKSPVVVHLVRFPQLSINHAVLLYDAKKTSQGIDFAMYDPNVPAHPTVLRFDNATRTFTLPPNTYFAGGKVNVYEIYWKWDY